MPEVCTLTGRKSHLQTTTTRKGLAKKQGGGELKKVGLSTKALQNLDAALLVNPNKWKNI